MPCAEYRESREIALSISAALSVDLSDSSYRRFGQQTISLGGAMQKGATAAVCALYLPNTGHTPDRLKDGITAAKPAEMGAALIEAKRKVFVF